MSSDSTPFKAPEKYPEPPTGMYYEVPKTPTYQKPAPIFPWERDAPKPTRVFAEDNDYVRLIEQGIYSHDEKDEPVHQRLRSPASHPLISGSLSVYEATLGTISLKSSGTLEPCKGVARVIFKYCRDTAQVFLKHPVLGGEDLV